MPSGRRCKQRNTNRHRETSATKPSPHYPRPCCRTARVSDETDPKRRQNVVCPSRRPAEAAQTGVGLRIIRQRESGKRRLEAWALECMGRASPGEHPDVCAILMLACSVLSGLVPSRPFWRQRVALRGPAFPRILIPPGAHLPIPALPPASKFPRDGFWEYVLLVPPPVPLLHSPRNQTCSRTFTLLRYTLHRLVPATRT